MSRWRVIAVRTNGERRILDEYMSREAAYRLRDMLQILDLFPEVFVEPDEESMAVHAQQLVGAMT